MDKEVDIEVKIRGIGLELFSAIREVPPAFDRKRWTGRIMNWSMKQEEFKIRLFRFIDVLPSLRSDDQVARLLQEYFSGEADVPKLISGGIGLLSRMGIAPAVAGPVIRKSIESMARQFIAGKDANDVRRPGLSRLFSKGDKSAKRNRYIYAAHMEYGYTLKEIADHVGIHYTTVSKAVKGFNEK
jgi:RHH-type proline utilization regulon transcriptional repressor/proline dehydrogenase/delta 1-pyrroline-5-carboxylate dehydrogenase